MDIEIKKLSPELLKDYLHYFDNIAFSDHKDWSGCYCVEPHVCEKAEPELPKGKNSNCRNYAIDFIQSGKLQGYLAYSEGEVVGWCNVNDKTNYEKIMARKEYWTDDDASKKIKSIICFNISKNIRNKGIASSILTKICADAAMEKYDIIEAYPYNGEFNVFNNYSGTANMYEKQGFSVFRELKHNLIMRKYL